MRIVVDADAIALQIDQVSPNTTANIERESRVQAAKMPSIRGLHIKCLLPPRRLFQKQPAGITAILRADAVVHFLVLQLCSQIISVSGTIVSLVAVGLYAELTEVDIMHDIPRTDYHQISIIARPLRIKNRGLNKS